MRDFFVVYEEPIEKKRNVQMPISGQAGFHRRSPVLSIREICPMKYKQTSSEKEAFLSACGKKRRIV